MDLRFIKLRVAGADLLLLEELGEGRGLAGPALARAILDRRRGVGGLRLLSLARSEREFWLEVYDGRGSRELPAFDAALCAARWLLDTGRVGGEQIRLRRGRGEFLVDVLDGSSLGIALGPALDLPERRPLEPGQARERRMRIETREGSFEALPLALGAAGPSGGREEGEGGPKGPEAVVVFREGGGRGLRVRLRSSSGREPPPALPLRIISEGELQLGRPRNARLDAASQAALALGAAALLGRAADEALIRSGEDGLWARRNEAGGLYVAARPAYVFRGEYHFEEGSAP